MIENTAGSVDTSLRIGRDSSRVQVVLRVLLPIS